MKRAKNTMTNANFLNGRKKGERINNNKSDIRPEERERKKANALWTF